MDTDHPLYLCVGDVAGHGPDAVELMVQLRNASRAWFLDAHEPHDVLQRLDALTASTFPDALATAAVATFDRDAMCLRVALAGHPPPLLARVDGEVEVLSVAPGPPLGASMGRRHRSADFPIAHEDTLFLYTDGLVERRGETIDESIRGLGDVLARRAQQAVDELVDEAHDEMFSDTAPTDDVCILAYRPPR